MPVNSCTMARKLDVSVVRTVVGARCDARVRFLEPLGGAVGVSVVVAATADKEEGEGIVLACTSEVLSEKDEEGGGMKGRGFVVVDAAAVVVAVA
jgi:hypothetical protein